MWTGGREVDVIAGSAVARAVVACGDGDGNAQRSRGLARVIEGSHRLRGPTGFRSAPADGDHAGVIGRVVHRSADRINKALVGVGCEVNHNFSARSDSR